MQIAINKAHFPVTVLGPGRRIGIWMQGCSLGCKGCISRDTWDQDPGRELPVESLLAWCAEVARGGLEGVTISGGEPFDQPQALKALLSGLAAWRDREGIAIDLLCYSGYPMRALRQRHEDILSLLDAVIPEPYVEARPTSLSWRGSANQPLLTLSDLGRARYGAADSAPTEQRMQFRVERDRIWYIGVPLRGDMDRLESQCRERGLDLQRVSWRS
jgi:anaerobic ribonucleoside-triphosphate reductase activating protein